jgi:hypothetical protein
MSEDLFPIDQNADTRSQDEEVELSRRGLLTSAGIAVAGGVGLSAAGPLADAAAGAHHG